MIAESQGQGLPADLVRRGFVLPFVLVAVAAAGMLAMAFVTAAMRAARAGDLAMRTDEAHAAGAEAMALALEQWNQDSLWTRVPGTVVSREIVTRAGVSTEVEWVRSAPLVAWLRVRAERSTSRAFDAGRREFVRLVHLAAPLVPVPAVVTSTGPLYGADGSLLSGLDLTLPDSPCGIRRDTLSVSFLAAAYLGAEPGLRWDGAPIVAPVSVSTVNQIDGAVRELASRVPAETRDSSRAPLSGATAVAGEAPRWRALSLAGPVLTVSAGTPWHGLLLLRGPLVIRGDLTVTGLVIVDGAVDLRSAQVRIRGALVAADPFRHGTHLGAATRILYDRCAVQMALATVARPKSRPFSLWHRLVE